MLRPLAIGILLLTLATALFAADPPSLTLDRNRVYEGDSVMLTLLAPDADADTKPDFSELPDARVEFRGSRSENRQNISVINGKVRREGFSGIRFTYEVRPLKAGPFKGGPIRIRLKNQDYTLAFPPLEVLPIPHQDILKIELKSSAPTILPDEPFTVTLRMIVKRLPPPYSDIPPFLPDAPPQLTLPHLDGAPIEGLDMPDIRQQLQSWLTGSSRPGIAINQYTESRSPFGMGGLFSGMDPFADRPASFLPPNRVVEEDGVSCFEYLIGSTFTGRDIGAYSFGPARLKGRLITGVDADRQPLTLELAAVAPEVQVRVVPPPEEGRPDSFFGLTGSNLVADARLNTSVCQVGDPLKLTIQLRGPVSWRNAATPATTIISNLTSRFQVYGSTLQLDKNENGRDITFTLRPLEAGTEEIPPMPFSWFDFPSRSYRTVHTAPIPLKVNPSAELTAAPWLDARQEESSAAETASFAKAPAALRQGDCTSAPSLPQAPFALAAAGPLVFLARLLVQWQRRQQSERKRRQKRRTALSNSLRTLAALRGRPELDTRKTATETLVLLRDFTGDWTGQKTEGLTPFELTGLLREKGLPREWIEEFEDLISRLSRFSYSPDAQVDPLNNCLEGIPPLLAKLFKFDSNKPTPPRPRASSLTLLLLGGVMTGGLLPAVTCEASGQDNFEWEAAQSLAFKAVTPDDFTKAAIHYNRLLGDDVRDPDLFYNMGTCLLLAKKPEMALTLFLRAERRDGRPADLVHNMDLARAALTDNETNLSWNRAILYVHYGLPLMMRLWAACGFFFLFWIIWTLTLGRTGGQGRLWMAAALFATLVLGTSVGVTLVQESQEDPLKISQPEPPHAAN
ncbi:MAG: BatD family protein [Kiritimatiellia bacterium]